MSAASGSSNAPGHVETSMRLGAGRLEEPRRARDEPLGQLLVEARDDDREPHAPASLLAALVALLLVVEHLLVDVEALVVQRVAHAVALGAQVGSLCGLEMCSIGTCSVTDRP